MYYGDNLLEESSSEVQEGSENYFSDTLNQILLPVTLIFVYMIALMAVNLLKTHAQLEGLMRDFVNTDQNKLIIEIQKQELIKAFEKIVEEKNKHLGLDLLKSKNYKFNVKLGNDGSIDKLKLLKLAGGKEKAANLSLFGRRIKASLSTKNIRIQEEKILYKTVLDSVRLRDQGFILDYKPNSDRRMIQEVNAKFLYHEKIIPYLDNSENEIIDFQTQLLVALSSFFNERLTLWQKWDPPSYYTFQEVMQYVLKEQYEQAEAGFREVQRLINARLKKDLQKHYFVLDKTWNLLEGQFEQE